MHPVRRFAYEYAHLLGVLDTPARLRSLTQTAVHAPEILRTRKLQALDAAMSCPLNVRVHGRTLHLPLSEIDALVGAGTDDSFTFGTIREMLADDVYLRAFRPGLRCATVLDLGCNRGVFSLLARTVLGATTVIGVEPNNKYAAVHDLLAARNDTTPPTMYWKMVSTEAAESADPSFVSVNTLIRENGVTSIDLAKIDIEGAEAQIFAEPEWLSITKNLAMELHPQWVDVAPVLEAVRAAGFTARPTDQFGHACNFEDAMFLYASRTGALAG